MKIQFMTTSGCHLCEQAYQMVQYLLHNEPALAKKISLEVVEISSDDELVEIYGIRIPVLVRNRDELGWPFELQDLRSWLVS